MAYRVMRAETPSVGSTLWAGSGNCIQVCRRIHDFPLVAARGNSGVHRCEGESFPEATMDRIVRPAAGTAKVIQGVGSNCL